MESIKVKIKIKTGFCIGSGFGLAGILDDTIVRDAEGLPYIPGTTLKGVIRDACEEISLIAGHPCYDKVVDELRSLAKKKQGKPVPKDFSPITQIFGSPLIPALFEFDSAYLEPDDDPTSHLIASSTVWAESHNSINISTGTAKKEYLFTHEVALPSAEDSDIPDYHFSFSIIPLQDGIDDKLVSLLLCGLRFVDRLGAKKSRGKGVVEFEPEMPYMDKKLEDWISLTFKGGQ